MGMAAVSGKLKSGKGKTSAKRHRNVRSQSASVGIAKPALRRLARRGGITRVSHDSYDVMNRALTQYLKKLLENTNCYTSHGKRKTVTVTDVAYALKHMGTRIVGFQ